MDEERGAEKRRKEISGTIVQPDRSQEGIFAELLLL